ncbi:MAG: molybdopterin-dependent oxidoreductase, partial [Burkholderiales bacterium]|nr:molybdopterin-dependent oxidoreductase [Burkholderiales bacterium]
MRYDDTRNPQSPSAARRAFLKSGAALGAGLAVGFRWCDAVAASGAGEPAQADPSAFEPNAWVRVFPDDTIKLVVAKHDSGTGTHTALPAVVAEELDVDPFRVDVITPENP